MIRSLRRSLISLLFSVLLACGSVPLSADTKHSEKGPLKLVTGPNYPPYAADYLPYNGLAPFIVTRILESGDRAVTVDLLPWKRAYRDTLNCHYDAILPYVESPARQEDYLFSVSIFNIDTFAYVDADSDLYVQSMEGLEGLTYAGSNRTGMAVRRSYRSPVVREQKAILVTPLALVGSTQFLSH